MNNELAQHSSGDDKWRALTEESFQKESAENYPSREDEMRARIYENIFKYEDAIRPFVDKVSDDKLGRLILEYEDEGQPLWAVDQGLLHELESALELKNKINLWHDYDPKRSLGAYYKRSRNMIVINSEARKRADDPLDFIEELSGLAHEVFHAYQYEQSLYGDEESSGKYDKLYAGYSSKDHIVYSNSQIEHEAYCFQYLMGKKILDNMHRLGKHLDLEIKLK